MNTDQKGTMAECLFDAEACRRGLVSSAPVCPASYDRILEMPDGTLKRIQVRYVDNLGPTHSTGAITVKFFGVRNGKQTFWRPGSVDVVVAYMPQTGKFYWLDKTVFSGRRSFALRLVASANNQDHLCNMASDYEW